MSMRSLLLAVLVLALAACGTDAQDADLDLGTGPELIEPDNYKVRAPDVIDVILNADGHPTIIKLCIDGVAFRTVSTAHQRHTAAVERVPEWDDSCLR